MGCVAVPGVGGGVVGTYTGGAGCGGCIKCQSKNAPTPMTANTRISSDCATFHPADAAWWRYRFAAQPAGNPCRSKLARLEFVPHPKGKPVEVSTRHRLPEKRASIEDSVIGLKIRMPVDLPANLHTGLIPNKTREAVAGRTEQETRKWRARNAVHTVM